MILGVICNLEQILFFRSFNHLSKLPGLTEIISSLSSRYDMSAFIESFLQHLVPRAIKVSLRLWSVIVRLNYFSKKEYKKCIDLRIEFNLSVRTSNPKLNE